MKRVWAGVATAALVTLSGCSDGADKPAATPSPTTTPTLAEPVELDYYASVLTDDGSGLALVGDWAEQKLRAVIYYPLNVGRNMNEIVRLVTALQATEESGIATPADWHPGDQVIVPPPLTQEAAEKRMGEPYDVKEWYFAKRDL